METMIRPLLEIGIAGTAMAGATESGDRPILCPFEGGVLVGVLDGLGHGPEASESAVIASSTLAEQAGDSIASHFSRCHARLRFARGVAMSLASFRDAERSMTWAGVGDVEGILIRAQASGGPSCEFLLRKAGVVGDHLPPIEESALSLTAGDLLLFLTDGIRKDALGEVSRELSSQNIADRILRLHQKATDDALVLVARYRGGIR
jgi:negative regulator of sigma-B (phosphoserine phosphatase)